MILIERENELIEVPFENIQQGDKVFLDGVPCWNSVICNVGAHRSGDADYEGWLFYDNNKTGFFPEDVKESRLSSAEPSCKVWARIGCWISVPKADEAVLFGDDEEKAAAVLFRLIRSQEIVPAGECYIPGSQIELYNNKYGTNYKTEDVEARC